MFLAKILRHTSEHFTAGCHRKIERLGIARKAKKFRGFDFLLEPQT
jgi:hypothetical protein